MLVFYQNFDWVLHELFSHLDDFWGHGGGEEAHLDFSRQTFENFSDFVNETSAQHLISFVEDDDFEEISSESLLFDQIFYPAGSANNDLDSSIPKSLTVLLRISSSNAASGVDFQKLAETEDDFIDLLCKFSGGSKDDGLAFGVLGVDALQESD